ncbi:hypothetical protein FVA95_28900 [Pseudonocardia sp. EV170527-09]|nr:hypothetical protein FVA95_28900 [Pseudonocardia sp. EV170527-09]
MRSGVSGRNHRSLHRPAATEAALRFLLDEGFEPAAAVNTLFLVVSVFTTGFVAAEQVPMDLAESRGLPAPDAVRAATTGLEALPEERFPVLRGNAAAMLGPNMDERFRLGLETVLDGVAARTDDNGPGTSRADSTVITDLSDVVAGRSPRGC